MVTFCPRCGATLAPGSTAADLCASCLLAAVMFADIDPSDVDELPTALTPGTALGDFRIVRMLGRGGMATVYEAEDTRLARIVALKTLPPEFLHDQTFAKRFEHEARVLASLEHPHIVPVYATGIDAGTPWMSMPVLRGGSVSTVLERQRLQQAEVVRILRQVALALDYAHAQGVVHRDIKPANLLLDGGGSVSVSDFGLARLVGGEAQVTRTGLFAGTPQYMAPEQALGKPLDRRCDIYSLGIVAYELFTGATPFVADSPVGVLLKQVNEPLPPPQDGLIPPAAMRAILKATAKDPDARWPTSLAFVDGLADKGAGRSVTFGWRKTTTLGSSGVRSSRWRSGVGAGALLATGLLVWFVGRERPVGGPGAPPIVLPLTPILVLPGAALDPLNAIPRVLARETVPGFAIEPRQEVPAPGASQVAAAPRLDAEPQPSSAPVAESGSTLTPASRVAAPSAAAPSSPDAEVPSARTRATATPPTTSAPDVLIPPVRVRTVPPDYPSVARAALIEGDVLLQAVVGPDGVVASVEVLRSVHPLLDDAAQRAVRRYQYTPGRRNGIAEPATVRITVSFRIR